MPTWEITMECTFPPNRLSAPLSLFLSSPNHQTQVSAQDKASGKSQKITITSDKGRLSEDEIARMVAEAEANAEADKQARERVEAKNQLEAYLYSVRNTATETLKDKLSDADKTTLTTAATEGLSWLEEHQAEDKATYDDKRKEVETVASPIITKAYGAASPGGAPGASESTSSADDANDGGGDAPSGPTVEEVD